MGDFQVCPDDHKCENGSLCVENPMAEGKYFCDCDEATDPDNIYSGLYCQHRATVYCTLSGEMSRATFCTNEGTCKAIVDYDEAHMGCDCPVGYEGEHCQFIEGSIPEGWPVDYPVGAKSLSRSEINSSARDASSLPGGAVVGIFAAIIASFGVAIFVRRRISIARTHVVDNSKSSDGHLHDADGQSVPVRPNTTPTFDSDVYMTENRDHFARAPSLENTAGPHLT